MREVERFHKFRASSVPTSSKYLNYLIRRKNSGFLQRNRYRRYTSSFGPTSNFWESWNTRRDGIRATGTSHKGIRRAQCTVGQYTNLQKRCQRATWARGCWANSGRSLVDTVGPSRAQGSRDPAFRPRTLALIITTILNILLPKLSEHILTGFFSNITTLT